MRIITSILCALGLIATTGMASAQPNTKLRPDETVLLYANAFEGTKDPVYGAKITCAGFRIEEANELTGEEKVPENGNLGNISDLARCDLYFPKKPNGQLVVVCPGGGYKIVSSYNEGVYVADWMLEQGITVCVVKYRLPNGHNKVPHTDIENAFRYCRAHASEWKVNQIGVMGFSAGGHLAATTSTMWTEPQTRPDFSILVYPVITMEKGVTHKGTRENLITAKAEWKGNNVYNYSLENQVTRFTPPTYIIHCTDDTTVPVENSLRYYKELVNNKVPAEMHIMPKGGHGWGFTSQKFKREGKDKFDYGRNDFYGSLKRWLNSLQ